jgi:putative ABC transport system permease protein
MTNGPDTVGDPESDSVETTGVGGWSNLLSRRPPALRIARRNISRTETRSGLAILSIVIGVFAIGALGVSGSLLSQSVTGSIGDVGDRIVVSPAEPSTGRTAPLTEREVREIERVSGDAAVVPIRRTSARVSFRGEKRVAGVLGMAIPTVVYRADAGRIPSPLRSDVLVGADLADELGIEVGDSLTVGNRTARVRAILAPGAVFSPIAPDDAIVRPIGEIDGDGFGSVVLQADSPADANNTAQAVKGGLNRRRDRVEVFEPRRLIDRVGAVFESINVFLVGIGSVSLLVAGVSTLNVMLMRTIERREEIGLLRAVGYTRSQVLRIVLAEALLLGVVGGAIGAVLSLSVGLVLAHLLLGSPMAVFAPGNVWYVLGAFVFAVVVSGAGGLYPAYRAAAADPVEALRD